MQTESSSRAAPAPAGSHWQHYDPCSGLTRASSGCLVSNAEDLRRATAAVAGKRGSGRILPPRGPRPGGSGAQRADPLGGRQPRARRERSHHRRRRRQMGGVRTTSGGESSARLQCNAPRRVPAQSPPSAEPPYDEVVPGRRPQPPLYTRPCRGLCLARPLMVGRFSDRPDAPIG